MSAGITPATFYKQFGRHILCQVSDFVVFLGLSLNLLSMMARETRGGCCVSVAAAGHHDELAYLLLHITSILHFDLNHSCSLIGSLRYTR